MEKNNIFTLVLASFVFATSVIAIQASDGKAKKSQEKAHVTKYVVLAAGLGTRFLPFTKAVPKEMLPIIDKPAIQYIVEEGVDAGITNFLMVTSKSKHALECYFDFNRELERILKEKNKFYLLESVNKIAEQARFTYVRQTEPLGTGHAVLMARHCIGQEYFAIAFPDDLLFADYNVLEKMISISKQEKGSVILVQEVPQERVSSYGVVSIKNQISDNIFEISALVEKPKLEEAPSNLAIVGRYVLSHKVFDSIEAIWPENTGELQLTDAINHMLNNGERVFVYKIDSGRHDTGNPLGWLKAVIDVALKSPTYGEKVKEYIAGIVQ